MTNKQEHTPGPWKYEMVCVSGRKRHSIFRPCVFTDELKNICEITIHGNGGRNIADEDKANAQLIANAPETAKERDELKEINRELLEAVKKMRNLLNEIRVYEHTGWSGRARDLLQENNITELIHKAEGRTK